MTLLGESHFRISDRKKCSLKDIEKEKRDCLSCLTQYGLRGLSRGLIREIQVYYSLTFREKAAS